MNELSIIYSNIEMLSDYVAKCRKSHKKISMEKVKFWAAHIHDAAEQKRRFDNGLPIGRVGVDFIC